MANVDVTWAYSVELPSIKVAGKPTITAASMKAVLVALADAKNARTGQCNPKQQVLIQRTALSAATVNRALAGLVQLGLVERQANPVGGGGRRADSYVLHHTNPSLGEVRNSRDSQGTNFAESQDELRNTEVRTSQSEESHSYKEPEVNRKEPEIHAQIALIDSLTFDDFWRIWPRKVAKKPAATAWAKATSRADPQRILDMARAYAEHPHRPLVQFIPHAATWLSQDRWEDELPSAPEPDHRDARPTQGQRNLDTLARITAAEQMPPKGLTA